MVMVSGTHARPAMPAYFYLYVSDVDWTHAQALGAGCSTIEPPTLTPYDDYRCMLQDPFDNVWQIASRPA
jgi:PhnB protein